MTAIGLIGSTQEGAMYLRNKNVWSKFSQKFKSALSTVKTSYFRALGAIFATVLPELEGLYDAFGRDKLIQEGTKSAMNTFSDVKLSGISCLRGLARHSFAAKVLSIT